tara:strand:+ start:492 stop:743 length:252 start_codon:yes stop_codon:yes gene_type:complete
MVEYLKILKIADNFVKYLGGELIFVYHPYFTRYLGSYAFQYGGRQYVTFIKDVQNFYMVICLQQKGLITFEKKITLINQTKKI